jgi:alpha-beta hydrolase superfamily lysophospholipase
MKQTQYVEDGLYFRHWPSAASPKAVVLLVHGLGEHCERYTALAEALNSAGYAVCSLDLPGHGRSDGVRGHISSFENYRTAVLSLHKHARESYPEIDCFIIGHSMGGLITTDLLIHHQDLFKGALLSGSAIQSPQQPPAWQISLITGLSKLMPKLGALSLDASCICRDKSVVDAYMGDPLVSKEKLSAKFLVEMFKTMEACQKNAKAITLPIRIMHGSADVMTDPQGSQLLHDLVSSDDKELEIYEGLFHEIFNEPEAPAIYQQVVNWLDKRN